MIGLAERFEWRWRLAWYWLVAKLDIIVHTRLVEWWYRDWREPHWLCRECERNWRRLRELADRRNNDPRWGLR